MRSKNLRMSSDTSFTSNVRAKPANPSRQERLHRSGPASEDLGDLCLREVLVVAEHEGRSLPVGEREQGPLHLLVRGDVREGGVGPRLPALPVQIGAFEAPAPEVHPRQVHDGLDRKSTRLNSSHVKISYAVFCLKKKKKINNAILSFKKHNKIDKQ